MRNLTHSMLSVDTGNHFKAKGMLLHAMQLRSPHHTQPFSEELVARSAGSQGHGLPAEAAG